MLTVNQALDIISSAGLSPTEHKLLNHFVNGAVNPDLASQYLVSRATNLKSPNGVETHLRHLLQDWKRLANLLTKTNPVQKDLEDLVQQRDGPGCFITKNAGKPVTTQGEAAHVIPPSLLQDTTDSPLYQGILDAFLGPSYVSQMWALLSSVSHRDSLKNLWLLSPSYHRAFRAGHVEALTMNQSPYYWDTAPILADTHGRLMTHRLFPEQCSDVVLGDGSTLRDSIRFFEVNTTDTLPLPSGGLLDIHRRFATALHLYFVEDKAARAWPRQSEGKWWNLLGRLKGFLNTPSLVTKRAVHWMWLRLPLWLRMKFYFLLIPIGHRLYGPTSSLKVHRLPLGLVVKSSRDATHNEANALQMVQKYTSIPAPRLIDVGEHNGEVYLIMTYLPGQGLNGVFHLMSYTERNRFADDLSACVAQLRGVPNNTPYKFANTIGGPLYDHRIPSPPPGNPCNSEAGFYDTLTADFGRTAAECFGEDYPSLRQDHRSFFNHSDFYHGNLLLENGRLSGIVDWECAGYKPEYWEFTKAILLVQGLPEKEALFRRVFGHQYEEELKVEKLLWRCTPFP